MADSITTNVILLDHYPVIEVEMRRLQTESMASDQWAALHKAAWRRVLQDLSRKSPGLVESDLSDTTQLYDACLYWVLHLAYSAAEGDDAKTKATAYAERYEREIQELPLEILGVVIPPDPYTVRLWRG